jgi:23S rRNA (cytosine1962-C5)-methyltransferase
VRRGNTYQGIILDPPAYGHGPDGEKWKLDELLFDMLKSVAAMLAPRDSFLVLNLYSNGYSATLGETVVREAFKDFREMSSGELALRDGFGKVLPLSIFVRLKR